MIREKIILASASPRRAEILRAEGFELEIISADVEEKSGGTPLETAAFNARLKAEKVAQNYRERLIIAADTVVCFKGELLGKPRDRVEAKKNLLKLSGNTHEVYTAVCLSKGDKIRQFVAKSCVRFKIFDNLVVDSYYALVDPLDKAGGYNINEHGEMIIESFEGSYENIMGLPIKELIEELKGFVDV
ncbi:Maf family protein [Lentisphaera profundi]|uniref:Nucleoside triphosphate pyrophosphatase n=1 Tax=Lentisphaera profundi TaxID=1658616 RepID=A0ABY7VRS3_9BACT|nr:nucleoside triphosphate pyrophosphatase [Lentisphaera profundi]WDE95935.1 Maf family protein [Lentisphaera profundi]